jgi:uncharacterized protein (DUF4415 family)
MNPKPDPEMIDDESPEWTDEDFARAVPFSQLPPALQATLMSQPRIVIVEPAGAGPTFESVPIRDDIVGAFQMTGDDWEQRINEVLQDWLAANFRFPTSPAVDR